MHNRSISYRFEFRGYQRRFKSPLQTSHGTWEVREGIILRLVDDRGSASYGEIAPISWFGSETLPQAWDFCCQLPQNLTQETVFAVPDSLPACQFGIESAWEIMQAKGDEKYNDLNCSSLLPAGKAALTAWEDLWNEDYRTFKWKIGVNSLTDELALLNQLIDTLPQAAKLRLDANGGLSYEQAHLWLQTCDRLQKNTQVAAIEFIEQPLNPQEFAAMLELSHCYRTAIALDESVATLQQLQDCYHKGWRGVFVIKPAIAGFPSRLRQFCAQYSIDAVFSSVFETEIGKLAALRLASELAAPHRAIGFGVKHLFDDADYRW